MSKFYVSFTRLQQHEINSQVIDRDCIVMITVENKTQAMKIACQRFDCKFSKLYDKVPNMKTFPRGIFDLNGNPVPGFQNEEVYSLRNFI